MGLGRLRLRCVARPPSPPSLAGKDGRDVSAKPECDWGRRGRERLESCLLCAIAAIDAAADVTALCGGPSFRWGTGSWCVGCVRGRTHGRGPVDSALGHHRVAAGSGLSRPSGSSIWGSGRPGCSPGWGWQAAQRFAKQPQPTAPWRSSAPRYTRKPPRATARPRCVRVISITLLGPCAALRSIMSRTRLNIQAGAI